MTWSSVLSDHQSADQSIKVHHIAGVQGSLHSIVK